MESQTVTAKKSTKSAKSGKKTTKPKVKGNGTRSSTCNSCKEDNQG